MPVYKVKKEHPKVKGRISSSNPKINQTIKQDFDRACKIILRAFT
jgi:hypothetical protein